jgi:hypothetical protein
LFVFALYNQEEKRQVTMVLRQAELLAPNEHFWFFYLSSFKFSFYLIIPPERKAIGRYKPLTYLHLQTYK